MNRGHQLRHRFPPILFAIAALASSVMAGCGEDPATPRPDLGFLLSPRVDGGVAVAFRPFAVRFQAGNQGDGASPACRWRMTAEDGSVVGQGAIPPLAPGQAAEQEAPVLVANGEGSMRLLVELDPTQVVDDRNRSDNQTVALVVVSPLAVAAR